MKYFGSMSLVSLAMVVPLLMGAKGGCGGDVSMGSDYGDAGMTGNQGGSSAATGGATGMPTTGGGMGTPTTGGGMGTPTTGGGMGTPTTGGGMGTPEGGRMGMPTTGGAMGMPQGGRMGMPTKCDGYENAEHRDEVTVRYVNASAETIYIGRTKYECAAEDPFALYSATGENLSPRFKRVTSDCMTCEAMQQSLGCPEICEFGILVEIQPGGSYETTWTATLFQSVAMPKACYANPDSTFDKCARAVQAPDGEYRVVASAWSDVECQLDAGCDCRPSGSGSCSIEDRAVVAGTPREVSAVLDYPAQKQVELRFE